MRLLCAQLTYPAMTEPVSYDAIHCCVRLAVRCTSADPRSCALSAQTRRMLVPGYAIMYPESQAEKDAAKKK